MTTDGTTAEIIPAAKQGETGTIEVRFKNLNRKVTSVFVKAQTSDNVVAKLFVNWKDSGGMENPGFSTNLNLGVPNENYAVINPYGDVSELTVILASNGQLNVEYISLNAPIPLSFSGIRLWVVSLALLALITLVNRNLREGAAKLFERKFDPTSRKQKLVYALAVALLIFFSWVCVHTSNTPKMNIELIQRHQQYNVYLVDAIIAGRTWLDVPVPDKLRDAENPYDLTWRKTNNIDYMYDWAFYNGRYYCYYGIVPAILLYVPYKAITGNYLSIHTGIFLFGAAAVVLLAALWRHCVKKYMPEARFAFSLLSFFALYFASGMFITLSYTRFYSIVQTAGFMFAISGILLLLKSVDDDRINRLKLFFACLCFALIAGCRPNMIFTAILIPVLLWKHRSWKLLLFVTIPFVSVAIPLCVYNYARFDSIFEFGQKYCLTGFDQAAIGLLNPAARTAATLISFTRYLFAPNKYSLFFPYVEATGAPGDIVWGILMMNDTVPGMINFPIVFCLFYMLFAKKPLPGILRTSSVFLIIAVLIALSDAFIIILAQQRFLLDYAAFFALPSLFCAYCWTNDPKSAPPQNARVKTVYALLAATMLVGLLLSISGGQNYRHPAMYRYLNHCFGFFKSP